MAMVGALFGRLLLDVRPAPDVAAPVVVAVPAALVALLLRETKHRLTQMLAAGARRSIAGSSLALTLGAIALTLRLRASPSPLLQHGVGWRAVGWSAASLVSVGVTIYTWMCRWEW